MDLIKQQSEKRHKRRFTKIIIAWKTGRICNSKSNLSICKTETVLQKRKCLLLAAIKIKKKYRNIKTNQISINQDPLKHSFVNQEYEVQENLCPAEIESKVASAKEKFFQAMKSLEQVILKHRQNDNTIKPKSREEIEEFLNLLLSNPETLKIAIDRAECAINGISSNENLKKSEEKPRKTWNCDVCNKALKSAKSFQTHVKGHEGRNPHICEVCGTSFGARSSFIRHQAVHQDKKHKCSKCDKMFRTKDDLTKHDRSFHEKEYRHNCSTCPKKFLDSSQLRRHERRHLGIKLHMCSECGKTFPELANLRLHMQGQHSGKELPSSRVKKTDVIINPRT